VKLVFWFLRAVRIFTLKGLFEDFVIGMLEWAGVEFSGFGKIGRWFGAWEEAVKGLDLDVLLFRTLFQMPFM
jgi:hypothetical protein